MMKKLLIALYLFIVIFLLGAAGIITIAQTSWFKVKLEEKLHDLAASSGFTLSFDDLKGSIPLRWDMRNLSLSSPNGTTIHIDSLRTRIAFLPLLRKELGIGFLKAHEVHVKMQGGPSGSIEKEIFTILETFPIDISIRSLRIAMLAWETEECTLPTIQLRGILKIKRQARELFAKITINSIEEGFEQEIFAMGGSRKGQLELRLKNRLDSLNSLSPILKTPPAIKSLCQLDVRGPWATWRAVALNQSTPSSPLIGEFFARIDHLEIPDYSFLNCPWKLRASFTAQSSREIDIKKFSLRSSLAELDLQGTLLSDLSIRQGTYTLNIPSLAPFAIGTSQLLLGSLDASGELEPRSFTGKLSIEQAQVGALHFGLLEGMLSLTSADQLWEGTMQMAIEEKTLHLEGDSQLVIDPQEGVYFKNLVLSAPSLHIGGDLFIDHRRLLTEGTMRLQADDLSLLDPLFPDRAIGGRIGAEIHFARNEGQSLKAYATLSDVEMRHLKIAEGTLSIDLHHIEGELAGSFDLHSEGVYLPNVYCALFDFYAYGDPALWHFKSESRGTWKEPFHLFAKGSLSNDQNTKKILFDELGGTFLSHKIKLEDKASLALSSQALCLEAPSIRLGDGELSALYSIDQEQWQLSLQGNEVPLAWLTLFSPYLSLHGESTIICALQGNRESVRGSCQLSLKRIMAKRFGTQPIFQAKGTLLANFEGQKMQLHSEVNASDGQVVLLDATLPLEFVQTPYIPFQLDPQSNYSASLLIEGKLEELSEFVNMSFQRWKGWLEGKVLFSGSLNNLAMQGQLAIHQGAYENDFLGLRLQNIEASFQAFHDELILTHFKATGLKKEGVVEGNGNIVLRPQHHFPYRFSATINHLPMIDLDLVEATLTGSVEIEGTSQKAMARGMADIDEAMFSIPRSLPADIPELPVTYIHQPAHVETQLENAPVSFPFGYDITFHSGDTIHFDAGGLTSRWSGDLHLHGVNMTMLASGSLRLNKGQFSLLGKTFQLNQGEITFSDRPGEEGLLNISGTLNMSDVTITAQLRGTLSEPQLTLQSVPPLTTSDIFSLLLFNKKVTEIKPMQAVQLARTVMSLSGNSGWNFVGQIGSGLTVLGIDTFDIIPSERGLDQTSITIGKQFYLIRGVLVSLTQSLSSSRFTVEVDLGGGLLFQAENESGEGQSQQVGKLSLKWNKNY